MFQVLLYYKCSHGSAQVHAEKFKNKKPKEMREAAVKTWSMESLVKAEQKQEYLIHRKLT